MLTCKVCGKVFKRNANLRMYMLGYRSGAAATELA
jgi:hypothetical protein